MPYERHFGFSVLPPFRLDLTVWTLRRRQKNLIDQWDGKQYKRVLVIGGKTVHVLVEQKSAKDLEVTVKSDRQKTVKREVIVERLQKILGTNRTLDQFYRLSENDSYLNHLAVRFKGMRPPRFPTIFEALCNSIACQQVSLDVGILLLNRLTEKYGRQLEDGNDEQRAFPEPFDLVAISEEEIKQLGFSYQKARAILNLAKALVSQELSFAHLEEQSNENIVNYLVKIRGIGRWSAEYVLLRGFGRIDTFPGDDIGAQNNLKALMNLDTRPNYEQIQQLTKQWKPYAGLVYFHLLLDKLESTNKLELT